MEKLKIQIIKALENFIYSRSPLNVYKDCIGILALELSIKTDLHKCEERKKQYKDLIDSYSEKEQIEILNICNQIKKLLKNLYNNFSDYLGEIYMKLSPKNKKSGQYFTPYHISQFMAEITLGNSYKNENKELTLNEPCCGSGGMMIAACEIFNKQEFNYTKNILIVANDIDKCCVEMCYLHLSYIGASAVIKHQDTITQEQWDEFHTLGFILQPNMQRRYIKLSNKNIDEME